MGPCRRCLSAAAGGVPEGHLAGDRPRSSTVDRARSRVGDLPTAATGLALLAAAVTHRRQSDDGTAVEVSVCALRRGAVLSARSHAGPRPAGPLHALLDLD